LLIPLDVSIYPNPVKDGKLFINTTKNPLVSVSLYDMQGRNVMLKQFNNVTGIQEIDINLKGLFVIKVVTTDGVITSRILLQ